MDIRESESSAHAQCIHKAIICAHVTVLARGADADGCGRAQGLARMRLERLRGAQVKGHVNVQQLEFFSKITSISK